MVSCIHTTAQGPVLMSHTACSVGEEWLDWWLISHRSYVQWLCVTTVVTPCATVINPAKAAIRYYNGAQNRIIFILALLSKKNTPQYHNGVLIALLLQLSYLELVLLLFLLWPCSALSSRQWLVVVSNSSIASTSAAVLSVLMRCRAFCILWTD